MADENEISKDELSKLGKYLAGKRRKVHGNCEVCGKEFEGTVARRYCSNTCAQRASREARKKLANESE